MALNPSPTDAFAGVDDEFEGTLVVLAAHETSAPTIEAFQRLRVAETTSRRVRLLLDVASRAEAPAELSQLVEPFDSRQFANWGLPTFGRTMLPGHCHYPLLLLRRRYPRVRDIWFIEYDVYYTGAWKEFLDRYAGDDADLLICHLRSKDEEPGWWWWQTLKPPAGVPVVTPWRCFHVVSRYSARALDALFLAHVEGWVGHQETVVPTALAHLGYRIRDLNGRALNCSQIHRRAAYSSSSDLCGSLLEFGTVRYRPPRARPGVRRNLLYHPVKPASMVVPRTRSAALLAKWQQSRILVSSRLKLWLRRSGLLAIYRGLRARVQRTRVEAP